MAANIQDIHEIFLGTIKIIPYHNRRCPKAKTSSRPLVRITEYLSRLGQHCRPLTIIYFFHLYFSASGRHVESKFKPLPEMPPSQTVVFLKVGGLKILHDRIVDEHDNAGSFTPSKICSFLKTANGPVVSNDSCMRLDLLPMAVSVRIDKIKVGLTANGALRALLRALWGGALQGRPRQNRFLKCQRRIS